MTIATKKIAVLISGRGTNMLALTNAVLGADIAVVVSDRVNATGLQLAQSQGIATECVDYQKHSNRADFERALINCLHGYSPDVVVLAGFMRVLTPLFIRHYQGRIINIHPSLLPALAGLNTHKRAIDGGLRVHGATVHFVDEVLDGGAIIAQGVVPVLPNDTVDQLASRVLEVEHKLLAKAVACFIRGDVVWSNGRALWQHWPTCNSEINNTSYYPPLI